MCFLNILSISMFSNSWVLGPARLGAKYTGIVDNSSNSIRCFAVVMRPCSAMDPEVRALRWNNKQNLMAEEQFVCPSYALVPEGRYPTTAGKCGL